MRSCEGGHDLFFQHAQRPTRAALPQKNSQGTRGLGQRVWSLEDCLRGWGGGAGGFDKEHCANGGNSCTFENASGCYEERRFGGGCDILGDGLLQAGRSRDCGGSRCRRWKNISHGDGCCGEKRFFCCVVIPRSMSFLVGSQQLWRWCFFHHAYNNGKSERLSFFDSRCSAAWVLRVSDRCFSCVSRRGRCRARNLLNTLAFVCRECVGVV